MKRFIKFFIGVVRLVVSYMMEMCRMKRDILKVDVLKMINKKNREYFYEIFIRVLFNLEVVFGVDIKEVDFMKNFYIFVSKMNFFNDGVVIKGRGFFKIGLFMNFLGVIFLKGNCVIEEKIWEFLNRMKIYDGKKYFIFGEFRKFII